MIHPPQIQPEINTFIATGSSEMAEIADVTDQNPPKRKDV
jgi:hypothetical protein